MMMAGLRVKGIAEQLRIVLTRQNKWCGCSYSAAAEQRSSGDNTTDGTDNDGSYVVRDLEKKASKLEAQVRELTASYNRAVSCSETVKKKTKKFVEDAKLFGIQSFCRDLVEVADIVEEAVESANKDGKEDMSAVLSNIEGKLQSVFLKHGLQKMTPVGGDYDPYDHEIVGHVPAEGRRSGSIATVSQDGYKLHGRTIRHAHVSIAVATQSDSS
ncbi:grpE protein homolog 2, mitochondrial [Mantella aurantiaca]